MKTEGNKVRIVYYDAEGRHETEPCNSVNLIRVNYSVPNTTEPTCTFSLWFGDDDNGHAETITVPFNHSIEPVPAPVGEKIRLDESETKTAYICWDEDEKTGNFSGYKILKGDELYNSYPTLYQAAELGTGYIPDRLLLDVARLQNDGYNVCVFF